jgi:hypothetical protein
VIHFRTAAGPTGCGKTFAATGFACDRVPQGVKFAFVQPTISLCRQSHRDAQKRFPAIEDRIRAITSRRGADDNIAHRITAYLSGRDEKGDLLFVTHAGFLRTPYWHRADTWHLFVDEPMEIIYRRVLRLKEHRHLILDFFHVRPSHHKGYGRLEARNGSELDVALATVKDDEMTSLPTSSGGWGKVIGTYKLSMRVKVRSGEAHTLEVWPAVTAIFAHSDP